MEKRIELERRARKANQITSLNLDNCRSTTIVGLTDEYTALESLSLINVGLTTLKGFPKLPKLTRLDLSDNRIEKGLNYLTTSPMLESLSLSGNRISELETFEPLKELKHLIVIDLFNNEVTHITDYRKKIFKMIPSLQILDGYDANDEEVSSDDDKLGSEEDVSDVDEEDSDESDGGGQYEDDVSLGQVYNDDLEEDSSDWAGEASGDNDEDDDDEDDDEKDEGDEGDEDAKAADKDADAEAEPQSRGKKRKHEG